MHTHRNKKETKQNKNPVDTKQPVDTNCMLERSVLEFHDLEKVRMMTNPK